MSGLFRRWYGASPMHLLVLLATFCVGGYAASRIYVSSGVWLSIGVWFVCAILGHDVIAWPVYTILDRIGTVLPHSTRPAPVPWINFIRIPVGLSLLLLLVYFPLIFGYSGGTYEGSTGISLGIYLGRWLGSCAFFFVVSAGWYALRLLRTRRATSTDVGPAHPDSTQGTA